MDNLNLNNKKILVTGGNGYLGESIVNSLKEQGADVYILDQKKRGVKNEFCIEADMEVKKNQKLETKRLASGFGR